MFSDNPEAEISTIIRKGKQKLRGLGVILWL